MARPRIVQKPLPFAPKACLVTGRADGDLVDFGTDISHIRPHLYIKRSEVEKAGKVCGMLSESEVDVMQEEINGLVSQNANLITELKTSLLHHHADVKQMAFAAASVAAATIIKNNPDLDVPAEAITACVEELFESPKEAVQ